MSETNILPPLPKRDEIIKHLTALIDRKCSREDAADWAVKWIISDAYERDYPVVDQEAWELLKLVAAADFKDSPDSYYYSEADFAEWIQEIQ